MPERLDTSMHVGLQAARTDSDKKPFGFVVNWIPWDSGFRGTDLRLGDVITAIDDKVFVPEKKDFEFGYYSEEQHWSTVGAKDGTPTTLTVVRDGATLKIAGTVRADRFYSNDQGKRTIGVDGPETMTNDGFGAAWSFWAEDVCKLLADAPYAIYHLNTRQYLERLEEHRARVEYLAKNYPASAFARAVKEDFDNAVEMIRGRKYDLTPEDVSYRSLSARRVEKTAELSLKARDEMIAKLEAAPLDSLPPADPVRGTARKEIAGRIVVLPRLVDMISEAGHGWYAPKGAGGSIFLVDTRSPQFVAIMRAVQRYRRRIAPAIKDVYDVIAKVTDRSSMVSTGRAVYTGIVVEPIAALVDEKMFVDVSGGSPDSPFAGETDAVAPTVDTRKDMTPTETFRSCINALKLGDFELWLTFYASWSCTPTGIGDDWVYDPEGGQTARSLGVRFEGARRAIMSSVYDMRVLTEGAPRTVYDKDGMRVEMVTLDVDPVGLLDGEYRSFRSVDVHRIWKLQRVDGGPWRIISDQGL